MQPAAEKKECRPTKGRYFFGPVVGQALKGATPIHKGLKRVYKGSLRPMVVRESYPI